MYVLRPSVDACNLREYQTPYILFSPIHTYFCCSVAKSCLTFCDPHVLHARLPCPSLSPRVCSSIESLMPSNHFILCRPLLLPPSIFPRIRVFPNELALYIRYLKYWSFSISPSNEYSGWWSLISKLGTVREYPNCQHRYSWALGTLLSKIRFIWTLWYDDSLIT